MATMMSYLINIYIKLVKIIFVLLMLIYGQAFLGKAAPVIVLDCAVIVLAVFFLVAVRVQRSAA